jgi:hypothetical protein
MELTSLSESRMEDLREREVPRINVKGDVSDFLASDTAFIASIAPFVLHYSTRGLRDALADRCAPSVARYLAVHRRHKAIAAEISERLGSALKANLLDEIRIRDNESLYLFYERGIRFLDAFVALDYAGEYDYRIKELLMHGGRPEPEYVAAANRPLDHVDFVYLAASLNGLGSSPFAAQFSAAH